MSASVSEYCRIEAENDYGMVFDEIVMPDAVHKFYRFKMRGSSGIRSGQVLEGVRFKITDRRFKNPHFFEATIRITKRRRLKEYEGVSE